MDKILIVIPVVNLWKEYTIHCLESIASSITDNDVAKRYEVVVVDNGSTDETLEHGTDFGNRKLPDRMRVLHNDSNRGCAGGWNQGVAWGMERGFTHFLIANNDILIGPKTIENLYLRFKREGVVPMLVSAVDVMREIVVPQQVLDPASPVNAKEDTEAPHPNFSCFMISRECVETVGYFDESFFPAYFEDNDYHYRIKLAHGPDAAIATTTGVFVHYGSRTQNQTAGAPIVPGEKFKANETYFIQKWGNAPGRETYTHPFNDQSKDLTYAKRTE